MTGQSQFGMPLEKPRKLRERIRELEGRLAEAEETLHALRSGEVDAVIASGPEGERVYTLRGADETYRLFVQEMGEGAVTLTREGLIVFSNEQFARMLDVPLERVIGARIQEFADAENAGMLSALLSHALTGSQKHELRLSTAGGVHIPVYISMNRLQQEGMDCVCAIVTNLTKQKRNERIVEAERLARSILQQAAEAILVVDPSGNIIRSSSAADVLAGTPTLLQDFDGMFQIHANDPDVDYGFEQILAAVRQNQVIKGLGATAKTFGQKEVEVLLGAAPLFGTDARLLGCVITLTDISEARKASRLLKQAGRRFRRLVESNIVGIVIASEKRVMDANAMILNMLGYTQEDFTAGRIDWDAATPPEYRRLDSEALQHLKETGACPPFEKELIRKDGARIPVLMGCAVLSFEPEMEWIVFVVDITAQRNIESELRRANVDLEQFAYSASHDLQEPLRNVSIYSQLLSSRYGQSLDGEALEFLEYIRNGASRMELLVRDLLDYTQVTHLDTRSELVDANEALEATLLNLKNAVSETGAQITSDRLPVVRMHKIHLEQLFQNLIGNALKYRREEPPQVHITARRREGDWLVAVKDNGMGIDPDYKDKIFGLFKRLHTGDEYAGTGIGLAICQRVVERYRGRIWVESKRGEGSTFYFTIPI